jgi:hypothetical protein
MSAHKYTKFANVSGFRKVDGCSLLVSHLVTLNLNLRYLGTLVREGSSCTQTILLILHISVVVSRV